MSQRNQTVVLGVIGVLALVGGLRIWFARDMEPSARLPGADGAGASVDARDAAGGGRGLGNPGLPETVEERFLPLPEEKGKSAPGATTRGALEQELERIFAALKAGGQEEHSLEWLRQWVARLLDADPAVAVPLILAFLESGRDADTGWGLELGVGGVLTEWPTLRTALLDVLGRIAPSEAEAYAREILENPRSGDEWAIGMRNLAWAAPGDDARKAELLGAFAGALRRPDWLESPSDGFLEAFDVAPYAGGTAAFDTLWAVQTNPSAGAIRWAAFLAMDRMVLRDRARLLNHIASLPAGAGPLPETRASLMARADIRQHAESAALDVYLRRPDLGPAEAGAFTGLFPNHNLVAGHRLFTPGETEARPMAELARIDEAALVSARRWVSDPGISAEVRNRLPSLLQTLEQHVASARRAAEAGELQSGP